MKKWLLLTLLFTLLALRPAAADVLVLVHGYLGTAQSWAEAGTLGRLAKRGYRLVGVLGYGAQGVLYQPMSRAKTDKPVYAVDLPSQAPSVIQAEWLAAQLETVPALTPTQLQTSRADAIWVLMAGSTGFNPELGGGERLSPLSLERIDQALALHRKTGLPIVISGGSVRGDTRPLAELAAEWLQDRAGVKPLAIDNTSRDTWENARDSAAVLAKNGLNRVLLVTHAYHMPRAVLSARAAGIDVVPAPFAFKHVAPELRPPMDFHDWLPNHNAMQDSYFVLHEMVGLVWYGLLRNSI